MKISGLRCFSKIGGWGMNRVLLVVFAVALLSGSLRANLLTDGSFETPGGGSGGYGGGSTALTGWTVINNGLWQIHSGDFGIIAPDGNISLDLTGYNEAPAANAPYWGGVEQTIITVPSAIYTIQFDVGSNGGTSSIQVSAGSLSDIAPVTSVSGVTWATYSSVFTASSTSTTIDLIGYGTQSDLVGLDNVVVELSQVPEPACLWLVSVGAATILLRRRRSV